MTDDDDDLLHWVREAARGADDMLAEDILVIEVGEILVVTDYFVVTNGTSSRQVHAIVDGVEEWLKDGGGPSPIRIEGAESREWVLMDYGAFVVHVFDAERRAFYQLERLWGDRPRVDWRLPEHATGGD